jgi:hypothetical protein
MNVALGSVGVAASTRPGVADGLAPYQSVLDLPIVGCWRRTTRPRSAPSLLPPRRTSALVTLDEHPGASGGGTKMAEEQGRATGGGRTALNIERIYSTTVTAEEIARALADHFRAQEFTRSSGLNLARDFLTARPFAGSRLTFRLRVSGPPSWQWRGRTVCARYR